MLAPKHYVRYLVMNYKTNYNKGLPLKGLVPCYYLHRTTYRYLLSMSYEFSVP